MTIPKIDLIEQFKPLTEDNGLSVGRYYLAAVSLGDYVIVAGEKVKMGAVRQ